MTLSVCQSQVEQTLHIIDIIHIIEFLANKFQNLSSTLFDCLVTRNILRLIF